MDALKPSPTNPREDKRAEDQEPEALEFTVMPKHQQHAGLPPNLQLSPETTSFNNWRAWGILGFAVLLAGSLGFFVYVKYFQKVTVPEIPLVPQIVIPEPKDTQQDKDHDGLTDKKEQELGTNPKKPDTDGDGLADGDEINVYQSDPLLFDTDNDGFEDGREAARGYSPVSNIKDLAGALELDAWSQAIEEFGLHEPTQTTLKLKSFTDTAKPNTVYTNTVNGYSVELAPVLTYRESPDGQTVGFYITGTTPEGEFDTDPIYINTAVLTEDQTLSDWVQIQYPSGSFTAIQQITVNAASGIKLLGVKAEVCDQDKVFFGQGQRVIILTWGCTQNNGFGPLYDQIIQSFKFVQ